MLKNSFPTAKKTLPQRVNQQHQRGYTKEQFGLLRSLSDIFFNKWQRSFFQLSHHMAVCFECLVRMEVDVAMTEQGAAGVLLDHSLHGDLISHGLCWSAITSSPARVLYSRIILTK